jgi:hypothetical protein
MLIYTKQIGFWLWEIFRVDSQVVPIEFRLWGPSESTLEGSQETHRFWLWGTFRVDSEGCTHLVPTLGTARVDSENSRVDSGASPESTLRNSGVDSGRLSETPKSTLVDSENLLSRFWSTLKTSRVDSELTLVDAGNSKLDSVKPGSSTLGAFDNQLTKCYWFTIDCKMQTCCDHTATIWQTSSSHVATVWRTFGNHVATIWQLDGNYLDII